MKIARVESFLFDPGSTRNMLFCRVETECGVHGWGEAYVTSETEKPVDAFLRAMAPHLIGRNAFDIRHTGQVLFNDFVIRRNSVQFLSAWSAVEIALWDIVAKAAGQPLYNLLGGKSRERIRLYANGWNDEPGTLDDAVERALAVQARGFSAIKFGPVPGPARTFIHREDEDYAVAYVRRMREALGPDMELLVEISRRLAPMHAINIGRRIAEYDIRWFEEPCLADNIELVAEVRRSVPIPIVTGETLYTKEDFLKVFATRAADILNPDVCAMGGIAALMDVAAMAAPHAMAISPHNNNSTLAGLAATVQVSAVIPNFVIAECFVNRIEMCAAVATHGITIEAGWAELPQTPGIGVDLDVAAVRRSPYREYTRRFRQSWEEFPRRSYAAGGKARGAGGEPV
ncbi:MAG: mandelate racemase/muconate lactonizing enzyme family protein [Acidisphaera sp.]|nr:mandelate racemase/muconate lactonizing enzyme family protein [Acidisphaera sp.]MBV9811416.1 mandelate racemase/muconate lactonizing enzyme family protein [Acetobacteraceae bacterium]